MEKIETLDRIEEMEQGNIQQFPAVALRNLSIVPSMVIHFDISRDKSVRAVEQAMIGEQKIFLVAQRETDQEEPMLEDVFEAGVVADIKQVSKLPGNVVRVLVEGLERARLLEFDSNRTDCLFAMVEIWKEPERQLESFEEEAMLREVKELFLEYTHYYPKTGKGLISQFDVRKSVLQLLDEIVINIPMQYTMRQKVLEAFALEERFQAVRDFLIDETEIAKIRAKIAEQMRGRVEKNQKEYLLREQLSYIKEELGEDGELSDAEQFEQALSKLKASAEVKEKIRKEIKRLKSISPNSSEATVERSYIETLLEIPWEKVSKDNLNIDHAEQILEADHYGLEKVKERILEFLSVRALTKRGDSPIICLVGPPGTGKTSIARSIAMALNKKYVRICLGGVRDEAEIRGHRRTYVGAMPGRLVAGLKQVGVKNPLMLLDEIDKVGKDHRGDTASALLEVLDSEQNGKFRDHYVEVPLDLSQVLFLATANSVADIPRPLLDRMEMIEVTSYTANEKFHIAKEHLLAKQFEKNGLTAAYLEIQDEAVQKLIQAYTKEAGVRDLERKIGQICRKAAREIQQKKRTNIQVTEENISDFLGKERYANHEVNETDEIGIVRGLAWTSVGGDTLQIEVNVMPGKGEIQLTGQLGDVMKESAQTGMSYIRSISASYQVDEAYFKQNDFHIHIPEGAVPKDGPSAGITMATALLSAITKIPVRAAVAMTGEITLRGRVLPIGGLKEKILAAKIAGITTVVVPKKNEKDIQEISQEILEGLEIKYAETMDTVLKTALICE